MNPTRPNAGLVAGAGVSCVALIVGAVGTWKVADVSVFGATVHASATGVEGGSDGPIVIGFAIIAGVMLLCYLLVAGLPVWAPIVALIMAGLALLTTAADTIDVASRDSLKPGWGLYLDLAASIALTATCALLLREALARHRATRPARVAAAAWPGQPAQPVQPTPPVQSAAVPPGWHPDPWGQRLRYWDGAQWTGHTAD
jgi:hypothetical protein